MFATKQATILNDVVIFPKRFKIEQSFLPRGGKEFDNVQVDLQGLTLCAICEEDASSFFQIYILYEPRVSMLIILQVWQVACINVCVAIPEASNHEECELSAALSRVKESTFNFTSRALPI